MNQEEDFSERWDARPQAYREFVNGVTEFEAQWKALLETRGVDKVARALERLFGEELAKRVVESQTRDIEAGAVKQSTRHEIGIGDYHGGCGTGRYPGSAQYFLWRGGINISSLLF